MSNFYSNASVSKSAEILQAAEDGHLETVRKLLDEGVDVDTRDKTFNGTMLHMAAYYGRADIVELLLRRNANVSLSNNFGNTPLHTASRNGRAHIVRMLVNGVDPTAKTEYIYAENKKGKTAIDYAKNNNEIKDHLTSYHKRTATNDGIQGTNERESTPNNNYFIHDTGFSIEEVNDLLLTAKSDGFSIEEIKDLMSEHRKQKNGKHMKSSIPSIDDEVQKICYSLRSGDEDNADKLLQQCRQQHYADPLKRSKEIVKAVEKGDVEGVKELLNLKVDVNTSTRDIDSNSNTILYNAADHGHTHIVQLLLEKGARANLANESGFTPLHIASFKGHTEIVEMLLDHGAKILEDSHGSTAFHYSVKEADITKLLLAEGADANQRDNYGNTALRYVCYYDGNPDVVKVLLEHGVNINAKNRDGKTAAEYTDSAEIRILLEQEEERLQKQSQERLGKAERTATKSMPDKNFRSLGCLDVCGQGAVGLTCQVRQDGIFSIRFLPDDNHSAAMICRFDQLGWSLEAYCSEANPVRRSFQPSPDSVKKRNVNGNSGRQKTYWVSIDKQRRTIRMGTGYLLRALQEAEFIVAEEEWKNYKMGQLKEYCIDEPQKNILGNIDDIEKVHCKNPVYRDLPPLVKGKDEITMFELDTGSAITSAELSPECQLLYDNVAGSRIELNTADFPDFAAAIDNSIKDPDGICHKKLLEKAGVFVKKGSTTTHYNANQQYLRITVGPGRGDSPGVPYVMEIWPPGCYSPIHNHSNANAIIKVLSGSLTTYWYRSLHKEDREPYARCKIYAGDVTWLDKRQFQTHRLFNHNVNGSACVTIQSYRYNDDDNTHYEYFDYLKEGGEEIIQQFKPNSDWNFETFKIELKEEWEKFTEKAKIAPKIVPIPQQGSSQEG